MKTELILLQEYCKKSHIEPDFIISLENEGLIELEVHDQSRYIKESQLEDLELFRRLFYELSVNIEGIDIINNMLKRMRDLQRELAVLKNQAGQAIGLSFFDEDFFFEF